MILKQLNRSKRCNKVIRANATMCKNFKYFNQVMLQPKLLEVSLTLKINTKTSIQKPKTSFNVLDKYSPSKGNTICVSAHNMYVHVHIELAYISTKRFVHSNKVS